MAEYNVIKAGFEPQDGVSWVIINSKWGTFNGMAIVADEDRDIMSKFIGCDFAEYQAYIKLLNAKARAFRERAKGVQEAIDTLDLKYQQMNLSHADAFLQKLNLGRVRDNLNRQAKETKQAADNLKSNYKTYCEATLDAKRKFVEKYHKS